MNSRQLHTLALRETDTQSALKRLGGDEKIYEDCLRAFIYDSTVEQLNDAIKAASWDEAFTAAHALKGVAGNMGFVPLMHNSGQLIVLIRGGRINELKESLNDVNSSYRDVIDAIHQYFAFADETKDKETL